MLSHRIVPPEPSPFPNPSFHHPSRKALQNCLGDVLSSTGDLPDVPIAFQVADDYSIRCGNGLT